MDDSLWEDSLLEKKLQSDTKDILKTLVGFANSVAPGHVAVLLLGERDDGTVQGLANPDQIQKKVRAEADKIYPPILYRQKTYEKEGKTCLRVEVENNGDTPHFAGIAYVRQGSETLKATDSQFQKLISLRLSKVFELEKWIWKEITLLNQRDKIHGVSYDDAPSIFNFSGPINVTIIGVNNFFVSYRFSFTDENLSKRVGIFSEPLERLCISRDHLNNRLQLILI